MCRWGVSSKMKTKFTINQIDSFILVNENLRKDLMKESNSIEDIISNKRSTDELLDDRLELMKFMGGSAVQ